MGGARAIWHRGGRPRQPITLDELFDRVVVCPSGCWLWAGGLSGEDRALTGSGYGRILRPGTRNAMAAHRYVYETFVGPIPAGHQVDHVCARWHADPWLSRRCVRPDHLECVTHFENMARRNHNMARTRELLHALSPLQPSPLMTGDDWQEGL